MKPLAQTFRINPTQYPSGIYLTSVNLYFASKPGAGGFPVVVEVRSVENGIPTNIVVPGSSKYIAPASITIPALGDSDDLTAVQAAETTFAFEEPIYLSPGNEYAIVVFSNSEEYTLYSAKIYEFQIGTTEKRINKQSGLGSLFLTQTGNVWTADQGVDLMVQLNKASFTPNTTYTAYLENNEVPHILLENNPISTDSGDATITMIHSNHGFVKNDYVTIYGLDSATTYNGILGTSILGQRQVTAVDHTGYTFEADSIASSSLRTGGDGIIVTKQHMIDEYIINMSNLKPFKTSISSSIKLTSGASYANNRNEATNSAYAKDASFSDTIINEYVKTVSPELIANTKNEAVNLSGQKSVTLKLDLITTDSSVSPLIDLQRASITSVENVIDRQDSASTTNFNVPLTFVAETDPQSGTSASKHITKPITLAETAVGLKVLLAANRPNEADFDIYFRTTTGDGVISDAPWVEIPKEVIIAADEDPTIFREYTYLAGGVGGELIPFSVFQIKVVFTSTNSSKVARIKDLRAIALAV